MIQRAGVKRKKDHGCKKMRCYLYLGFSVIIMALWVNSMYLAHFDFLSENKIEVQTTQTTHHHLDPPVHTVSENKIEESTPRTETQVQTVQRKKEAISENKIEESTPRIEPKVQAVPTKKEVEPSLTPESCNEHEIEIIQYHLPSDKCDETSDTPWRNMCSFSFATRCVYAVWMEDYYKTQISAKDWEESTFLGISIGCNKGLDALNTMRMGTFDRAFDRKAWNQAREDIDPDIRCFKGSDLQFSIYVPRRPKRRGEMHCVEALPSNYNKLKKAADKLDLTSKGFIVNQVAIADKDGTALFHSGEG